MPLQVTCAIEGLQNSNEIFSEIIVYVYDNNNHPVVTIIFCINELLGGCI